MRIIALGDSLTYGFPYDPSYSWVAMAAERLRINIDNRGVCGETTGDMLLRFPADVLKDKPNIVLIMGGTNDAFEGIIEAEVMQNIRLMAIQSIQHGIRSVIGLPPFCTMLREERLLEVYRAGIANLCRNLGVPIIDFYSAMHDQDLLRDGVHPNEQGYIRMADTALPVLQMMVQPE